MSIKKLYRIYAGSQRWSSVYVRTATLIYEARATTLHTIDYNCIQFEYNCIQFEYNCIQFEYNCIQFEYNCIQFEYNCIQFEYNWTQLHTIECGIPQV
jgi:hypothetical protein